MSYILGKICFVVLTTLSLVSGQTDQYNNNDFLGEIRMFGGNYAPRGWAFCEGQILNIDDDNSALFALLGTMYGGNGRTTFALPDLRGRAPVHFGQGAGLSRVHIGEKGGQEGTILNVNNLPSHSHSITPTRVNRRSVSENLRKRRTADSSGAQRPRRAQETGPGSEAADLPPATEAIGSSEAFSNRSPYLGVSYIIRIRGGTFPSR